MNVYDFDGTILSGDTEEYFREYILKHFNVKLKDKFEMKFFDTLYKMKLISTNFYRSHTYPFIKYIPNLKNVIKDFWDEHEKYIFPYYLKNHKDDDVVVSATPRILLEEIMKRLKIKNLISSELNLENGKFIGKVCRGKEKVVRYNKVFNELPFENYYFDKDHDMYLMKYSKNGYRVNKDGTLKKEK